MWQHSREVSGPRAGPVGTLFSLLQLSVLSEAHAVRLQVPQSRKTTWHAHVVYSLVSSVTLFCLN